MLRLACALAAITALSVRPQAPVDAVAFVQAFRSGAADQFKNRVVSGTGMNFHGAINERIADGTTRSSLIITIGSARDAGAPALIKTWDAFVEAERARTTLVVALSGVGLPVPAAESAGQTYQFSGIYDGQVRTVLRLPQASADARAPEDAGPCKGETPKTDATTGVSFYCAPLLVNATAAIKP